MLITTKQAYIFFAPLAPAQTGVDGTVPFPDVVSWFGTDDSPDHRVLVGVGGPFQVPDWVSNTLTFVNGVAAGSITVVSS